METLPVSIRAILATRVMAMAMKLEAHVKTGKLTGQVLNVRTGNLKSSIHHRVESTEWGVVGHVFSDGSVKYAGIHEFGFNGTENVKEFTRKCTMVFGRQVEAFTQLVRAHVRNVNMPMRSFLRSGLADMADEISRGLKDAVLQGIKGNAAGASG